MFTTLLILICCFSLVVNTSIDQKYIDGKQYIIKSVDTTYVQRVNNNGMFRLENYLFKMLYEMKNN
jgi:hypothetical protein